MRSFRILPVLAVLVGGPAIAADPYDGPIYDGHAHLAKSSNPEKAYAHVIEAGFDKAVLFVDIDRIDQVLKLPPGKILVFVDPFKRQKIKISRHEMQIYYSFSDKRLADIREALEAGQVAGFGEIYFRLGYAPFAPQGIRTSVDGRAAKSLFEVARTYKVPVQIHLDGDHVAELEQVLRDNADVTIVLAHCGYMPPEKLGALMDKFPNLHAETSLIFNPMISRFANLPLKDGRLRPEWEALLTRHADRILIGTDYAAFRAKQVPKLLAYYRQFLGLLPRDKAEQIAYRNFERLFMK